MRLCSVKSPTIVKQQNPDDTTGSLQVFTDPMQRQSFIFTAEMQITGYPKVFTSYKLLEATGLISLSLTSLTFLDAGIKHDFF